MMSMSRRRIAGWVLCASLVAVQAAGALAQVDVLLGRAEGVRGRGRAVCRAAARGLAADGPDKRLLDLHFVDERGGFVVGAYNLILRTDDGGAHWQSIGERLDNPRGLHLYAIAAEGATLYIAGEQGLLLRSDDGGKRFERLTLPYTGSLVALRSVDRDRLVAARLCGYALL